MFGMSVTIGTAIALFIGVTHVTAGRTTIMIAHRLHTLRHCDLQLMLRQARIVVQVPDGASDERSHELVLG